MRLITDPREIMRDEARKLLRLELKRHDNACHWCSRSVISPRAVRNRKNILKLTANTVTYRYGGEVFVKPRATVDHIKALSEGGTNQRENLTIACAACNRRRAEELKPVFPEHACQGCGKKTYSPFDECRKCRRQKQLIEREVGRS